MKSKYCTWALECHAFFSEKSDPFIFKHGKAFLVLNYYHKPLAVMG